MNLQYIEYSGEKFYAFKTLSSDKSYTWKSSFIKIEFVKMKKSLEQN